MSSCGNELGGLQHTRSAAVSRAGRPPPHTHNTRTHADTHAHTALRLFTQHHSTAGVANPLNAAGHPALPRRHSPFECTVRTAERYMQHMGDALKVVKDIDDDSAVCVEERRSVVGVAPVRRSGASSFSSLPPNAVPLQAPL